MLADSQRTRSTVGSMSAMHKKKVPLHSERNSRSYKYKVSVQDVVDSCNRTNQDFVLPGYYSKVPAPITSQDKPTVFGMSKDAKPRDFISFY